MSRLISELLGATEPQFSIAVKQLEQSSGKPGVDVRLTAEIIGQVYQKTAELKLDPKDTTGKELYSALIAKFKKDNDQFAKTIGGKDAEDAQDTALHIIKLAKEIPILQSCWVIKKSVAKEFLKQTPPPNVMKILGYKSVDSMLKNENIIEIYGALRFAESPSWLNRFNTKYKTIKPSDFESRKIEIFAMPSERWLDVSKKYTKYKGHNITHLKELGAVIMLPVNNSKSPGYALTASSFLFKYINEIRLYSTYFKLQQVKPDFGTIVVDTLVNDPSSVAVLSDQKIHWRVIQRFYSKSENQYHPEIFEPHVQAEDLYLRKAENILYEIDQELGWWRNLDYVAINHQNWPVTFNMLDVSLSCSNNIAYKDRPVFHFRDSLWNELFARYMGEKSLEQQVFRQLGNNMILPDTIASSINAGGL